MPVENATFEPYQSLLDRIASDRISSWSVIEAEFIEATSAFDTEYKDGERSTGWYQAKARYFNDLIVELLSNASGKPMATRRKKRSQLFDKLDIDVCYPDEGDPLIGAEVKALGTPPHRGNSMKGRAARSDLHKRIREVAFTSIDFKVAHAPPTPIGSFQAWVDASPPGYFSFWAMRVQDDRDFETIRTMLVNLRTYCNGVGAVIFRAVSPLEPTRYRVVRVHELDIDRNLREMAQRVA